MMDVIPQDCQWSRLSGGGQSWLYLMRPKESGDPKVYGACHERDYPPAAPTPPRGEV